MKNLMLAIQLICATSSFGQNVSKIYDEIGKRQHSYGAEKNKIQCAQAIKQYEYDYKLAASKFSYELMQKSFVPLTNYDCPRTDYESIVLRHHCNLIQNDANQILKKYNIDTSTVFFAVIPCNCFNTLSAPLNDLRDNKYFKGKWLVEYNVGFSLYTQKLSTICADLAPFSGNVDSLDLSLESYKKILLDKNNYNTYYKIAKFMLADIAGQPNISSDSIEVEKSKNPIISASLTSGFNYFALAHELSHIILNHHIERKAVLKNSGKNIDIVKFKFNQEYEADSLALIIISSTLKTGIKALPQNESSAIEAAYRYSPLIFLSWLNVLQKFEFYHTKSFRGINSHPSASDRRDKLLIIYNKLDLYDKSARNFADFMDGSSRFVLDTILQMFELDDKEINFLQQHGDENCRINIK